MERTLLWSETGGEAGHVGTSSILIYIKSNRKPVNIKTMK